MSIPGPSLAAVIGGAGLVRRPEISMPEGGTADNAALRLRPGNLAAALSPGGDGSGII
jgi:hypothetical protein